MSRKLVKFPGLVRPGEDACELFRRQGAVQLSVFLRLCVCKLLPRQDYFLHSILFLLVFLLHRLFLPLECRLEQFLL